jgi:two-component system chemotaxis response regulator CheY
VNLSLRNLRVLVVDDTPLMGDLIRGVLSAVGVPEVRYASNGQLALQALGAQSADIVFVDWEMGSMSGLQLTKAIRHSTGKSKINPQVPIIMMTSYADEARVISARNAGIHEYLIKPFTGRSILNRLAAVINDTRRFVRSDGYVGPERRPGRQGSDAQAVASNASYRMI